MKFEKVRKKHESDIGTKGNTLYDIHRKPLVEHCPWGLCCKCRRVSRGVLGDCDHVTSPSMPTLHTYILLVIQCLPPMYLHTSSLFISPTLLFAREESIVFGDLRSALPSKRTVTFHIPDWYIHEKDRVICLIGQISTPVAYYITPLITPTGPSLIIVWLVLIF